MTNNVIHVQETSTNRTRASLPVLNVMLTKSQMILAKQVLLAVSLIVLQEVL